MLGSDQDCFGGCPDAYQSFFGLMDEVSPRHVAGTAYILGIDSLLAVSCYMQKGVPPLQGLAAAAGLQHERDVGRVLSGDAFT